MIKLAESFEVCFPSSSGKVTDFLFVFCILITSVATPLSKNKTKPENLTFALCDYNFNKHQRPGNILNLLTHRY